MARSCACSGSQGEPIGGTSGDIFEALSAPFPLSERVSEREARKSKWASSL